MRLRFVPLVRPVAGSPHLCFHPDGFLPGYYLQTQLEESHTQGRMLLLYFKPLQTRPFQKASRTGM